MVCKHVALGVAMNEKDGDFPVLWLVGNGKSHFQKKESFFAS